MKKIGFWEAFSIGVGGMIGGGIFAVLGLSIQIAKGAAPLSFLIAGIVALLTSYSYAKLSRRYPSKGGTIEFLVKAFGNGVFTGTLNILLLASYIVMISLYAYAFGSYGASLFGNSIILKHVLISLVIVFFVILNALGAYVSGKTEDLLVGFKLAILILVVVAGIWFVKFSRLSPSNWVSPFEIVAGGMIMFLAYEGFELIANTGKDIEDPSHLPKAFYSSVLLVTSVYVLVSLVVVGTVSYDSVLKYRDYVLAIAAEPILGKIGFLLIVLAALLSTSSAINATLYGTARMSYMVAKFGQLPKEIEKRVWKNAYEGLLIIAGISLLLANLIDLESIAIMGSLGFLIIFTFINLAAIKLRKNIKANLIIPLLAAGLTLASIGILISNIGLEKMYVVIGMIFSSFVLEFTYRLVSKREIREYTDMDLKIIEDNIRNWSKWAGKVSDALLETFKGAEIYLVGSIARNEIEKAHDVDILVFTDRVPSKSEIRKITHEVKRKAGLNDLYPVHLHFARKSDREEILRKIKHIRLSKG